MIRSFVANISPAISHRGWISISQYSKPFNKEQTNSLTLTNPICQTLLRRFAATTSTAKKEEINVEDDTPVSFTKSKAFKTKPTFLNPHYGKDKYQKPPSQDLSIGISLGSFMIYFFFLREENDLDEALGESLYDRVPGLEKATLINAIRYHEREGLDTTKLNNRMSEILAEEEQNKKEYEEKEKEISKLYVK